MTHEFDRDYWEQHWQRAAAHDPASTDSHLTNPYLVRETSRLTPGSALDAGCGKGIESVWLAGGGWQVTAADISATALHHTATRAAAAGVSDRVHLLEADLGAWEPAHQFDLVLSLYAHPNIPQLEFYGRLAEWVKPGGTLLLVGHLHTHEATGHDHPPAEASVTAGTITDRLDPASWHIDTTEETTREVTGPHGQPVTLHDVVVRATRLP